jgi:hypothetical protein
VHRRSQIFDAVKARLAAIPEFSAAGKVERGRTRSIPQETLPALTLTWADQPERATIRPSAGPAGEDGYERELPLSVIVHLRDEQPDDEFDRICAVVEAEMGGAIQLNGSVIEMTLQSTEYFVDRRTGLPLHVGQLVYLTSYTTLAADPETAAL